MYYAIIHTYIGYTMVRITVAIFYITYETFH